MRAKETLIAVWPLLVLGGAFVASGIERQPKGQFIKRPSESRIQVVAETPDRLVRHLLGETRVPRAPQRIASLNTFLTDTLLALDIRPVAVESQWRSRRPAGYLALRLSEVPTVGQGGSVSLEALLRAKPDLILAGNVQDGKIYDALGRIAPTVFVSPEGIVDREALFLEIGVIVGLRERAIQRLAEYRERLRRARQTLARSVGQQPVVFLRFRMRTCVIYSRTPKVGPLLFEGLGLTPDSMVPSGPAGGGWDVLSIERLSTLSAEYLLLVADSDSEAYLKEVSASPLWQEIPAVKRGRVHRVPFDSWIVGEGILAYEAMIEDVLAAFVPKGS